MKNNKHSLEDVLGKKYLSIGEVADKLGVSKEVIRKWEHDFPWVLHPKRTGHDTRLYDPKQVERVELIYRLLYVEHLTIEGAKLRLKNKSNPEEVKQEVISSLRSIREQLLNVVNELDSLETVAD